MPERRGPHPDETRWRASPMESPRQGEYTPDELEWMRRVDEYRRVRGRRFPTLCELLAVLRSLGYRKTARRGPLPRL